jgi:predicted nucleic acid-binding protein
LAGVLLDTTVLIDVLRGRPAANRLLALRTAELVPWTCPINVEEVWRGLRRGEEEAARRLFNGLRLAPLNYAAAERAGTWRRDFASRGRTLAQADCLVAAAALSVNATLATGNMKDFPMKEIELEHWPVGT